MKKNKKVFLAVFLLAVMAVSAACGLGGQGQTPAGSGTQGQTPAPAGGGPAEVTLRFTWWGGDNRHADTIAAVEAFMEQYPHITVEVEPTGWDGTVERITTQLAGGTEPDLMQVNFDWLTSFTPDGTGFYDLRALSHIIDFSGYEDSFLAMGEMNGVLQGIPHGNNAYGLAVNATVWERFGASFPPMDGAWTWQDVVDAAALFEPGYYPFATNVPMYFIFPYVSQITNMPMIGTDGYLNFTIEDMYVGLEFYSWLIDNNVLPDRRAILEMGGHEFFEGTHSGEMIWTGGMAERAFSLADTGQELRVVPFPRAPGAQTAGAMEKPTMLFAISANTAHPEETAMLLNFILNDPVGISHMGLTRGTPANYRAAQILEDEGRLVGVALDAFHYTQIAGGMNQGPIFEIASLRAVYEGIYEEYALGAISRQVAAERLYHEVQEQVFRILGRIQ